MFPRNANLLRNVNLLQENSTNLIRRAMSSHFNYHAEKVADNESTKLNMFQAINSALDTALKEDESCLIFGEDVGFGGVFRCTLNLQVPQFIHLRN